MSLPLHVSVSGGFLGGPNLSDCHSHSTIGSIMCHGLLFPISAFHLIFSPFPQTYQPVLGSHQVLHSPQDSLVFFILFLPTTLFAHPFPRPVSQCLDPIKSSTHLKMAWFASSHCAHHLVDPPFLHRVLRHGRLDGRLIHRWFGCSLNVSHQ